MNNHFKLKRTNYLSLALLTFSIGTFSLHACKKEDPAPEKMTVKSISPLNPRYNDSLTIFLNFGAEDVNQIYLYIPTVTNLPFTIEKSTNKIMVHLDKYFVGKQKLFIQSKRGNLIEHNIEFSKPNLPIIDSIVPKKAIYYNVSALTIYGKNFTNEKDLVSVSGAETIISSSLNKIIFKPSTYIMYNNRKYLESLDIYVSYGDTSLKSNIVSIDVESQYFKKAYRDTIYPFNLFTLVRNAILDKEEILIDGKASYRTSVWLLNSTESEISYRVPGNLSPGKYKMSGKITGPNYKNGLNIKPYNQSDEEIIVIDLPTYFQFDASAQYSKGDSLLIEVYDNKIIFGPDFEFLVEINDTKIMVDILSFTNRVGSFPTQSYNLKVKIPSSVKTGWNQVSCYYVPTNIDYQDNKLRIKDKKSSSIFIKN